jgi:hypothetical protein
VVTMRKDQPALAVRQLDNGAGYVVEAVWPDGTAEQLPRVYVRAETAMAWIADAGIDWLAERFPRYH